jgi:hypothetical protein
MFRPNLSDEARVVLRVINDNGIVRGGAIMGRMEITDPRKLVTPIKDLLDHGLIGVTGDLIGDTGVRANAIPFATFSTRPSAQGHIRALLQTW